MTDKGVPSFLAALGIPGIVDAHVPFLPDNLQEAVWRWLDRPTPARPVTYRCSAEDRLATLAGIGVRHHTALAYPHQPGMLRYLNDHTLRLAEEVRPSSSAFSGSTGCGRSGPEPRDQW